MLKSIFKGGLIATKTAIKATVATVKVSANTAAICGKAGIDATIATHKAGVNAGKTIKKDWADAQAEINDNQEVELEVVD